MCVDRLTHGLRELYLSGSSKSPLWGISSEFPLVSHLALPGPECIRYLRMLPCVHVYLLAKMDSSKEACG